jgi:hypothetical protein
MKKQGKCYTWNGTFYCDCTFNIDVEGKNDLNWWKLFKNPFEHIWFKNAFDLENYGFWKCGFNKSCVIYIMCVCVCVW